MDSSLDWGQGLPALAGWLEREAPGEDVFLSYFGSDRPSRLGIRATRFGDSFFRTGELSHISVEPLRPGLYAISATMWRRVYTFVRGPWRPGYERRYQELRRFWLSPAPDVVLLGHTRATLPEADRFRLLEDFDQLRFGRLCHYLAGKKPAALVANQFLVFRLDATDLRLALEASLPDEAP